MAADPNVQSVELVAYALGDLCEELILVGGCAAGLLLDAPTAPPPRVTWDVDLLAVVTSLKNYYALEEKVALRGFTRDLSPDAPICRWRLGEVMVDLMPTESSVLGFSNRWYPQAAETAAPFALPSGRRIRLIAAPAFLATKFEAFKTRGKADPASSHDLEDIINVTEGRPAIVAEVVASSADLRNYLAAQFGMISEHEDFRNVLPGLVAYDALHAQRVATVMARIAAIAALAEAGME